MKILLINNIHYRRGGADVVYFNLAELLKEKGHDIYYFSTKSSKNEKTDQEEYFAVVPDFRSLNQANKIISISKFIYNKDVQKKLETLINKINPDIVHIHLYLGGLSSSILPIIKKYNIPIVQTIHDYRLICPAYSFTDGKNQICERCIDKVYIRCALRKCSEYKFSQSAVLSLDAYFRKYINNPIQYIDRFLFVSNFSLEKHCQFNPSFRNKSQYLYNFIPKLNNDIPPIIRGSYFLFYGRISSEKGLDTLLEAFINSKHKIKIVGDGPLLKELSKKQKDNIEFLGFRYGNELIKIIREASFIILPSICYENNPLSIVEAYSYGKPVIGSNIGGIPEIINDNSTGFLFEANNPKDLKAQIKKASNMSNKDYSAFSQNAFEFAKNKFNPKTYYSELIKIYKSLVLKSYQ